MMQDQLPAVVSQELTPAECARQAAELFQTAYRLQSMGLTQEAVEMFQRSIERRPTAEAHTYLGRAYRVQGRLQEAVEECKAAIEIDPQFGNSYNDLGAYLVDQGEFSPAIPWLERALGCERYATPHFAWYNLGRAHMGLGELSLARACQRQSLKLAPDYALAREAIRGVQELIQARNRATLG
jgi:tetratricopeptide (TPR) repeat protein